MNQVELLLLFPLQGFLHVFRLLGQHEKPDAL